MTETQFTKWFCGCITKCNGLCLTFVGGNSMQQSSLPDRFIAHTLFRGWCEFKKDNGRLSEGQRVTLRALGDRGCNALIVRYRASEIIEIERLPDVGVGGDVGTLNLLKWIDRTPLTAMEPGRAGRILIEHLRDAATTK